MQLKKKRHWIRFAAMGLAVCLLAGTVLYEVGSTPAEAKSLSEIQQEITDLNKKIQELNNKISANKKKLKDEEEKIKQLDIQIDSTQEQITAYGQKIEAVNTAIALKEEEIKIKEAEVALNEEQFAQRVRSMYISNSSASAISTLLSSKSFADFLNRTEYLKRISQADTELINTLKTQKSELDTAKAELVSQQNDLTSTQKDLESKQKSLETLLASSLASKSELVKTEKSYMEQKEKEAALLDAANAEYNKLLASLEGNEAYGDGKFIWPCPGYSRISSYFGWRTLYGKADYHTGVDMAAAKGTSILAADAGKVILVKKVDYGYGWHIIIDHGNGLATLYGHTSRIDVTEGQMVTKGQVIAGVGTTGNSTGYHLHFEVRVTKNGKTTQVDPLAGYISIPK